jgi:hypothetical protein
MGAVQELASHGLLENVQRDGEVLTATITQFGMSAHGMRKRSEFAIMTEGHVNLSWTAWRILQKALKQHAQVERQAVESIAKYLNKLPEWRRRDWMTALGNLVQA